MSTYLSFLVLVLIITVAPGPDTALTLRASLASGRAAGLATMAGVSLAGAAQGLLAAGGLGADGAAAPPPRGQYRRAMVQGFLCNITNPKVLAFNLAVLPQFIGSSAAVPTLALYALSLVALGALWLTSVALLADRARAVLSAPHVRRRIEGTMGTAMIGFAAKVATEG